MLRTEHELRVDLGLVRAMIAAAESGDCTAELAITFGGSRRMVLPMVVADVHGLLDFLRRQEQQLADALVDAAAGKPAP